MICSKMPSIHEGRELREVKEAEKSEWVGPKWDPCVVNKSLGGVV